jgi:hypothetical protein
MNRKLAFQVVKCAQEKEHWLTLAGLVRQGTVSRVIVQHVCFSYELSQRYETS